MITPPPETRPDVALATERHKFYLALFTAVAGLITSAWTGYVTPGERQVKASYDTLVAANKDQVDRLRRLETLLSVLLVDSGKDPTDVSAALGAPDPVIKLLSHPRVPAPTSPSPPVDLPTPVHTDYTAVDVEDLLQAPAPKGNTYAKDVRVLVKEISAKAEMPPEDMPAFDAL